MNSIRRRLSRDLLAVTLALVGGGIGALFLAARHAAIEQFDVTLRAKAMALSTMTVATAHGLEVQFGDQFLQGFEGRHPHDFFEIWDTAGKPIARSGSLGESELPRQIGTVTRPEFWNLTLPRHHAGRAIGFAFQPKASAARADPEPAITLVVASHRGELDETLWGLLAIAGGCAALLVGTTLWVVPRVLRSGLRPLDDLAHAAARIDATSLSTRFAIDGLPTELRPIAVRLNDLLARLEHSFERERRFSADLAHELRTPLAELRTLAECALKWPAAREPGIDRETLAIAHQMERLVGFILALARAEDGELQPRLQPVAVDAAMRDVWRAFAPAAQERRLTVTLELAPAIAIADAVLLRSILGNLIENAVNYAPAGGALRLESSGGENGVRLIVANDAPGLDEQDLPRLFDRFWRKEAARSGGQHVGLGLSLARAFAQAMGWTLAAEIEAGRIAFTVSAPGAAGGQPTCDRSVPRPLHV